jgi:hypothetical protein
MLRVLLLSLVTAIAFANTQTVSIQATVTTTATGTKISIPAQTLNIPLSPACGPQPPSTTTQQACPAGTTGTWQQTTTYTAAPAPTCWVPTLTPASAPTGACTPVVVPPTDPTTGFLPAYNDAYANWKNAGMATVGGIPNRMTICSTVNPLGNGQDDYTNIQNAINACAAGGVVQLGAGAFNVKVADLPISISKGIVLRGTGDCSGTASPYCQTSISVMDGALAYSGGLCGLTATNTTSCPNGGPPVILMAPVNPDYDFSWAKCGNPGFPLGTGCGATSLTADASQGQLTIQVANTTGLAVGQWVLIDEASGAGWVADPMQQWTNSGGIWAASDWLSASPTPVTGRVQWAKFQNGTGDFGTTFPYQASSTGCWFSYCDRPTAELHKIISFTATSVTFDDPLTIAFRISGSHAAQIYPVLYGHNNAAGNPIQMLQSAGLENLSVLRGVNGGVEMELCVNCWIKNTEVGNWYGGGVNIRYSARSELNNVYVHHCWNSVNSGTEYPIDIGMASTEILVTNSITNFGGKGMVARAGGAGSVVSYSYVDDSMYDSHSGIGDYWLDMGLNASHYAGPHHVLFEGNWADNLESDNTHGNTMYVTFFRNQSQAARTPFIDTSISATAQVNDFAGIGFACGTTGAAGCRANPPGFLHAAGPMSYNYWFSFVGNVLGASGQTTAANGWTYTGDWSSKRIWAPGWSGGTGGQDPYLNGVKGTYMYKNGNYDYLSAGIVDWAPASSHTLPNSFYLAGVPSFFTGSCSYSWPWVTPASASPVQKNSCGGSGLPSKARYEAGTPLKQI